VRGRLLVDGQQPAVGVRIEIEEQGGEAVGTATTGPDGTFALPLPGPGSYSATLDQESLPQGVRLRDPARASLKFSIRANQNRPLLFALTTGAPVATAGPGAGGGGGGGGGGGNVRALQLLLEGVRFGLIIAITAIGLSLIFGTTGLTNFSHGELVTLGAVVAWYLNVRAGLQLIPATALAVVIGALTGALLDRGLWRPLRNRGTGLLAAMIISIGLSLLARYLILYQFGGRNEQYADYGGQRARDIGPVSITDKDLASIAISLLVLVGVALLLQRSRIGKAMRAVSDNRDLAASSGIDVARVVQFVWMLGGGLAALGGVLYGLSDQVSFQMGFQLLLLMFAGITLGGLGTAYGALLGSVIVGVLVQMSTLVVSPELKNVGGLLVLILILVVRPNGLLGARTRIG